MSAPTRPAVADPAATWRSAMNSSPGGSFVDGGQTTRASGSAQEVKDCREVHCADLHELRRHAEGPRPGHPSRRPTFLSAVAKDGVVGKDGRSAAW